MRQPVDAAADSPVIIPLMMPTDRRAPNKSFSHPWFFALIAIAGSVVFCLVAAEVVLRFLPVNFSPLVAPVNAAHPVFHFEPNQHFLYSRDWNFSIVNSGRINNDGFVNDRDYTTEDPRMLLAVVGDSYVEAMMVPNAETFYGRLAAKLGSRGRIYSFGASGAPLSQYLIWARYAAKKFKPVGLVIVIVGNDFDESVTAYKIGPGFYHYSRTSNFRTLQRFDYRPGRFRAVVIHSALARYLVFNLQAYEMAQDWLSRFGALATPAHAQMPPVVGNTASDMSPQRVADSIGAIHAFFRDLPEMTGLPADRIAFILDGARYAGDIAISERSYFGEMRRRFMAEAAWHGYEVIDLQPRFVARSADGKTIFEFPTDGHWNSTAHGVVAQALASSRLYQHVFDSP